jgi:hypothetical protein
LIPPHHITNICCSIKEILTAESSQYGYPLLAFLKLANPILLANGTNEFFHERDLSTPSNLEVVRPNVDTLYSAAVVDLSIQNVVITVPDIPDRFWAASFYDLYGNNYANLGSVNFTKPGKYLIQPMSAEQEAYQGDCEHGYGANKDEEYIQCITVPTAYSTILTRYLVKNNSTDLDIVRAYQDKTILKTVSRSSRGPIAPKLKISTLNAIFRNDTSLAGSLRLLAYLAPFNPAEIRADNDRVNRSLETAGLKNGVYNKPLSVNLTAVGAAINQTIAAAVSSPNTLVDAGNNWAILAPDISGDFGTNYIIRLVVAEALYLQLQPYEALYPSLRMGTSAMDGTLSIGANESMIFTFSSKPDVRGFWSITAYNNQGFLIENPVNRYSVGDRSNITYPDGSLVYAPDGASENQEFQILVQPADVTPPGNWTNK